MLALVRGVLYAFDPLTGALHWARRLGVDTAALPVWLPATEATPATVLVCSSEAGGLVALDAADGRVRWVQDFQEPCLGPPVLIGNRTFVACPSGAVYEVETVGGRLLGGYQLGQELKHPGVHQPGTALVYFAGNRACVYVVDVAARRCQQVLYTGHASGGLRCPPVILPLGRPAAVDPNNPPPPRGQLLLCVDDGNQATRLVTHALPLADPPGPPVPWGDKLAGHVWFPPHTNTEQAAIVTDAGALAVLGLKQRENRDADLFLQLRDMLPAPDSATGPAQVVHMDGQKIWLLARGHLYVAQAVQSPQQGWKMVARPVPVPALGAPLHAAQVLAEDGGTVLYVVTETPEGRGFRITAVDAERQTLRWQRQIGYSVQRPPVAVAGKILAWDRSGDVLLFDPEKTVPLAGSDWHKTGRVAATALQDFHGSLWIVRPADSQSAVVLTVSKREARLWKYSDGVTAPLGPPAGLEEQVAGTPGLVGDAVLMPLANGRLARLDGAGMTLLADWRADQADKNALGQVIPVGPTRVVTTDGSSGLVLWQLAGKELHKLGRASFNGRVLAAAVLPGGDKGFGLCVADVTRTVTLLHGDDLTRERTWTLGDAITAGPFVRGGRIGVVVGHRRLVWLDPQSDQPIRALTFAGEIVGEPELIDGVLVVADQSGRIQGFDPATLLPVGLPYTLQASVAPAATPLPYGADRLFVPLTDGTVLLLSRAWFRPTLLGLPLNRYWSLRMLVSKD